MLSGRHGIARGSVRGLADVARDRIAIGHEREAASPSSAGAAVAGTKGVWCCMHTDSRHPAPSVVCGCPIWDLPSVPARY
eukprot:6911807-Prymnesium_polylepis.2